MSRMVLYADKNAGKINRNIYGHFAEHLGRCIYGGIYVGEDSPIPNIRGIRKDVIKALKELKVPVLRWPGGCFADEYHWKDGIGPKEQRPTMVNTHWGGVTENNHFGTREFMDLCELIETDPYICGNVGSGTVREMSEWVEYITFEGQSPMADLRRENGREEPWKLPYFGVGNENWGCGGQMRPEYYADLYRQYQTYVRQYGPNPIYKIAGGANTTDYKWTEVLMREARTMMDGLSLHYYTVPGTWENKGSSTDFTEDEWFTTLKKALFMDELVAKHAAIMDLYDPEKRVGLIVDEWGTWYDVEPGTEPGFLYQQNTLRDALVAGIHLNIFNGHCDRVQMANLAQTVNVLQAVLLTEDDQLILTPTYHVMRMFNVHQDAQLLPLEIQTDNYVHKGEEIPQINASASLDSQGAVHISLCNLNPNEASKISCEVVGKAFSQISGEILTAEKINDYNSFDQPELVAPRAFTDAQLENGVITAEIPAKSVVVLKVK